MFSKVAIVLFLTAVVEFYAFRWVGGRFGVDVVLLAVVGSIILGAVVLRSQITHWLSDISTSLNDPFHADPNKVVGRRPVAILAGVMLLTPGLISSAVALILLVPPVQAAVAPLVRSQISAAGRSKFSFFTVASMHSTGGDKGVVDVDGVEVLDDEPSTSAVTDDPRSLPPAAPRPNRNQER